MSSVGIFMLKSFRTCEEGQNILKSALTEINDLIINIHLIMCHYIYAGG
jgi:hypothetical protein